MNNQNKFEVASNSAKHGRVDFAQFTLTTYRVGAQVSRPIKFASTPLL